MANDVEVTNYGDGGVASEATLASILRSMKKIEKSVGGTGNSSSAEVQRRYNDAQRNGIRVSRRHSDALNDNTESTEALTRANRRYSRALVGATAGLLGSVTKSLTSFGEAVMSGGSEITDFSQHIPLVGSSLSVFTSLIDENISNFRTLSQVGATFGNGLNDIRQIAANASMPLNDFVSLISENSDTMKLFGSDVASGSRNFAMMSKELRQGPGRELMNLGYTSSELNELLLNQAEIQSQTFDRDRIRQRITAQSAAEYAKQMQDLSVITGKRRDQLADELKQQSADIRMMSAVGRMGDQADQFRQNLAAIGATSSSLQNALLDFSDGIPTEEVTRRLMQMSDTFRVQGQRIQEMDPRELHNFVVDVRGDLQKYADQLGLPLEEVVSSIPGLAESMNILGETSKFAEEMSRSDFIVAKLRQAQEEKASVSLKNFQETMNEFRGRLMTAFINSGVLETTTILMTTLGEQLEKFIKSDRFEVILGKISTVVESFTSKVSRFISDVEQYDIKTALFGDEEKGVEGLVSGFSESLSDAVSTHAKDMFSDLADTIGESIKSAISDNKGVIALGIVGALTAGPIIKSIAAGILGSLAGGIGSGDQGSDGGRSGGRRRTQGLGKLGKDVGKFAGNLGGGVLKGAAKGLAAFANPKVVTGATMLGSAIAIIGAGIAGASWIMGKSLPTLAEGLQSFEELNGAKLTDAGKGMIQIAAGLAAFGGSTAISGIGSTINNVVTFIPELFGADSPMEKLEAFQEFDIVEEDVRRNAQALTAFSEALKDHGGVPSKGVFESIGDSIVGLMSNSPMEQLRDFSSESINVDDVRNNAQALMAFSEAMKDYGGVPSKGAFESFGESIGGLMANSPLEQLREFSEEPIEEDKVEKNARALSQFGNSLATFTGIDNASLDIPRSFTSRIMALSNISGGNLQNTAEGLQSISNVEGLKTNIDALKNGFDVNSVNTYNDALERLVDTLNDLNEALAEDNEGNMFNKGTGVASADVLKDINISTSGSAENMNKLNSLMAQVLETLRGMSEETVKIEKNTSSMGDNIILGRISSVR